MKFKRIASLTVALAMSIQLLAVGAFAADDTGALAPETAPATAETAQEAETPAEPAEQPALTLTEPVEEEGATFDSMMPGEFTLSEDDYALLEADPAELSLENQLKQRELAAALNEAMGIAMMALGDAEDPYLIANADQLKELASLVNAGNEAFNAASYKLVGDIDLAAVCGASKGNWTPIGIDEKPFRGSFDGDGHAVAGLYINDTDADYQGLFGNVTGTGTIKNLGVTGANVTAGTAVGIVVGKVGAEGDTVTIENCYTSGTVTGKAQTGGVAGCLRGGAIKSSYNTAAVAITESYESVGGVVSYAASGASVENCYNTGTVTGVHGAYAGGLVGRLEGATAENCFSAGTVTGGMEAYVAGIVASVETGSTVTKCVALNQSVATGHDGKARAVVAYGPISGEASNTIADNAYWGDMKVTKNLDPVDPEDKDGYSSTKLTYDANTKAIKDGTADFAWPGFEAASWDNVAATTLPTLKNAGGSQSSSIPGYMASTATEIFISNAAELKAFADKVNNGERYAKTTVKLTADIDLSSVCSAGGKSWTPIGKNVDYSFLGTFDGQNHTISNLYINENGTGYVGLFGYCTGTIQNLGVVNANVIVPCSGASYVGIIAGKLCASIKMEPAVTTVHLKNCYSTGTVQATESGTKYVGGLVGYAQYSTIQNGYSTAAVTATSGTNNIGGVLGWLEDATIENCYSTGKVSGSVTGASATGGVVGFAGKNKCSVTSVTNCVALNPSVSGRDLLMNRTYTGVVLGNNAAQSSAATITGSSYWNGMEVKKNGTAVTTGKDQTGSAPLTYNTAEAKLKTSTGDFEWPNFSADAWENVTASTLPTLKGIPGQSSVLPAYLKGASDEILISNVDELQAFAAAVNGGEAYAGKAVKLTANLDLSSVANWTAIGSQDNPFKGIFDGQGHTVSNLKIDKSAADATAANNQGLFGCVADGTVKNLGVLNANVKASSGLSSAGTVVGYATGNTTIENCYATGNVEADNGTETSAGGIVGAMAIGDSKTGKTLTVKNCYSTAKVTSKGNGGSYAGGTAGRAVISGSGNSATVENCYSTGEVTANHIMTPSAAKAGGVMGIAGVLGEGNSVSINNCLGLNSGVKGYYAGAVLGKTEIGTAALTGNAYWTGMTVKDNNDAEQAIKDSTGATALATQDGYLNDGNGKLDWSAMGFAANGWVAPTEKQLLPCFTGMTANLPAMPFDSASKLSLAIANGDKTVAPGPAALTATTIGNGAAFTYQWYEGDKVDDSKKIADATAKDYTTGSLVTGTHQYTVNVTATKDDKTVTVAHTYTVTVTGGTPKQIVTNLDLTAKLPAPVKNGTPQTTVTDAQYTGTVAWTPSDVTFRGSIVYTAAITLTPAEGYTLEGLTANSFAYTGATSTVFDPATGKVTVTFPMTENRAPVSLTVTGTPEKTVYNAGEAFDPAGLTVTITYDNGDMAVYNKASGYSKFSITPATLAVGTTSVTLGFGALKSNAVAVTVRGTPTPSPAPSSSEGATPAPAATAAPTPVPAPGKFTVNAWVNVLAGGVVSPMGNTTYTQGKNVTYTITPAAGYRIAKVTVDGVDVGAVSSYTFNYLNRSHTIGAYFEKSAGAAGSVIPATADEAPLLAYFALALAALALGTAIILRRKNRK